MSGKQKSIIIVAFLIPFLVIDVVKYFTMPSFEEKVETTEILIPGGATLSQIGDSLEHKNLIGDKNFFVFWAKSLGYETKLRSGLYHVPTGLNYPQLVTYLAESRQTQVLATLIEGWQSDQIFEHLSERFSLQKEVFDSLYTDKQFLQKVGVDEPDLCGYLLPDTYGFAVGTSEQQILEFLVERTIKIFEADSIQAALSNLKMDRQNILTLASIIEGEAILDSERTTISSVYHNRLIKGIKLQADPTIQYILEGPPRRLLYKDLEIDSPYNTYKYYGLPPGPINNPGKASILAAIFPEKTNYIYFVAKGDGSHIFSRTAAQHAKAKAAFNRLRRKVYGR